MTSQYKQFTIKNMRYEYLDIKFKTQFNISSALFCVLRPNYGKQQPPTSVQQSVLTNLMFSSELLLEEFAFKYDICTVAFDCIDL